MNSKLADMESVRFSIIENNMNWEEQQQQEKNEEEERKSISSESSGEGIAIPTISTSLNQQQHLRAEIWEKMELEAALTELPNSEQVERVVKSNNYTFQFSSGDSETALLFAVWQGNCDYAAHLLRVFNTNPNASDLKGRTTLHYSCILGDAVITKLLLKHSGSSQIWESNLVNLWDNSKRATPLHCAASSGSLDCIQILLRNGAQLNAGIEKRSPLHYAVQKNAIACVLLLLQYGAVADTPQVYTETPLHIAAANGHLECLKILLNNGSDVRSQFGDRKNTALHLAAEDDYFECVKLLLEAGASINARNADNQTALHVACLSQSVETVEILIKYGADITLTYRDGRTAIHASIVKESRGWECTRLLLESKADVNKADHFGYTPLHIAALNEFSSCAFLLIEYGADITARTNGGVSALSFIVRRTPEVIPKYLAKFDTSIKVNEHEIGDVDCEIKLDFRCLVPNFERGETELLLAFIEVGQKRVLKHPLCETFLFLKWRRIRKFFLFSLFYHAIYVLLFTIYILGVYVNNCKNLNYQDKGSAQEKCEAPFYIANIGYIVLFLNTLLLAKEIFQMAHGFMVYIRYWENWLQWSICNGVFLCTYPQGEKLRDLETIFNWQYHVAALIVFLVWLELMMLVGRFPVFGLYVQMFTTVAVNFSKFLLAYCCLLIAFGLSFCVLFSNFTPFNNVSSSILKTVVMMAGELEFENIFFNEGNQVLFPITSHTMFFAFVILVTVILTNLLVGLAVNDIQGLQASAGLNRLCRQAELVARLEGMVFSKLLKKSPKRILSMLQRQALLRTSRWNLQIHIKPNDPREKRIPKDIMMSIYKLVAERRDRNQSLKRKRNNRNLNLFKDSMDEGREVQYRTTLFKNLRHRTVSEQPPLNEITPSTARQRINSQSHKNDLILMNINKQLFEVQNKFEALQNTMSRKLDDVSQQLKLLKLQLKNNK